MKSFIDQAVVTRKSLDKKYSDGKLTQERIRNTQKFVLAVKKIMFN